MRTRGSMIAEQRDDGRIAVLAAHACAMVSPDAR